MHPGRHSLPVTAVIAGGVAVLLGLGFARFAFAPLMPAMIEAQWFTAAATAYLGAANLLGYLLGAVTAAPLAARFGTGQCVRLSLVTVCLSFLLCVVAGPFTWFFIWRLLAGWAGAVLMVLAPSMVLTRTPLERRPFSGALVFSGIGWGVLIAAVLVPLLLDYGLSAAWLALGVIATGLTLVTWRAWADSDGSAAVAGNGAVGLRALPLAALLVVAAYALDAVGFVPHILFWVDFLAREQGHGVNFASVQWGLFAVGGIAGPFLAGWVAARLGWYRALLLATLLKALVVLVSAWAGGIWLASVCSLVVGAMAPAVVSLTSGYLAHLVPADQHRAAWGWATAGFALLQAAAAYAMAGFYGWWGTYPPLFILGGVALLMGAVIVAATRSPWVHGRP